MTKRKTRKIWAILGAVLLFVVITLSCFGISRKNKVISASADTDVSFVTENLIDLSNFNYSDYLGVSFSVNNDGSLLVNGRSTATGGRVFLSIMSINLSAGTYTLSACVSGCSWVLEGGGVRLVEVSTENKTFTLSSEWSGNFYIVYAQNAVFNNAVFYPMLNRGSVAYPYIPNLDFIYNLGSDFDSTSIIGYFYGGKISGTLIDCYKTGSMNTTENRTFSISDITYVAGGINFNQFVKQFEQLAPYGWQQTEINFIFAVPVSIHDMTLISFGSSTSALSAVNLYDINGKAYVCDWGRDNDRYVLSKPNIYASDNVLISSIKFIWGGGVDGLNFTVVESNNRYYIGYSNGYSQGYIDGDTAGRVTGSNSGYSLGYNDGYIKGSSSADNSMLGSAVKNFVYALFDAPFQSIEGILSFNVAGLDLGGVFGTILTLILIVFVLKVVV